MALPSRSFSWDARDSPLDCKKSGHHQLTVDNTTPTGRALFQMMGAFVEFERTMIKERIMVALRRFRDN
jgi:hypothetical protein